MDITTGAIVVTGLATALLAFFTWRSFEENRKLIDAGISEAKAATDQARASGQQAEAALRQLEEVRYDRELAAAPYLTLSGGPPRATDHTGKSVPMPCNINIKNIGRGPALTCMYCACLQFSEPGGEPVPDVPVTGAHYYSSPLFHLGAGDSAAFGIDPKTDLAQQIVLKGLLPRPGLVHAVVCEDQFGTRYRFLSGQAKPEQWKEGQPSVGWEDWRPYAE
jgi:hypothetical protein